MNHKFNGAIDIFQITALSAQEYNPVILLEFL
jgi:hypothetical protein